MWDEWAVLGLQRVPTGPQVKLSGETNKPTPLPWQTVKWYGTCFWLLLELGGNPSLAVCLVLRGHNVTETFSCLHSWQGWAVAVLKTLKSGNGNVVKKTRHKA